MNEFEHVVNHLETLDLEIILKKFKAVNNFKSKPNFKNKIQMIEFILESKNNNIKVLDEQLGVNLFGNSEKSSTTYANFKFAVIDELYMFLYIKQYEKIDLFRSTSRKETSKVNIALIQSRRNIFLAERLLNEGNYDFAFLVLKKGEKLSFQYEHLMEYLNILEMLSAYYSFKGDIKNTRNYKEKIQIALEKLNALTNAKLLSRDIFVPKVYSKKHNEKHIDQAQKIVSELKQLSIKSNLATIKYHFLRGELFYFLMNGYFIKALKTIHSLLECIRSNPAINDSLKAGFANLLHGYVLLELKNYKRAMDAFRIALEKYSRKKLSWLQVLEGLINASISLDDISSAKQYLKKALKSPHVELSKGFQKSKWTYIKANILFKEEKYSEALTLLRKHNELTKDYSGWSIGFTLLEIMILIELEIYDPVEFKLRSTYELMRRKKESTLFRYREIFKVLKTLNTNGFNFQKTRKQEQLRLKLIEQGEGKFYRDPIAFEIIQFHLWFKNK
ncbi:MAG: tetratricopeptide (TPR) repeat protein [Sphingobacteriales bacterium]|jgi:tetratricopeptide (TPR) repeat protein